ncbi:uncharacterized protein LOC114288403 [Camellia sinensis]|uniref:uncharacterized protein LOC114288403 n=1 Tax=Camellia sinensis TaxID=4442 RepID=UPI001036037B|nr:uncharacterized protein LOC114288403 [Camellia sinensis]
MNLLRAENQARENATGFLTREFLRAKPDKFFGGHEPKKVDEWFKKIVKTFEMLHIEDSELRVTLASYYLKRDVGQWWKYAKGSVEPIWEAFVIVFQDKYLPPTARERLRQEFLDLKQNNMSMAEFEAAFLNYAPLVEAVAHVEVTMQAEKERHRGSRSRGQESQGNYRQNKKRRGNLPQSQPQQSRSTFPLPSTGPEKSAQSGFSCFKCGQPGHKVFACPQKGGKQLMLPPPPN